VNLRRLGTLLGFERSDRLDENMQAAIERMFSLARGHRRQVPKALLVMVRSEQQSARNAMNCRSRIYKSLIAEA